jgi:hypothetical protein
MQLLQAVHQLRIAPPLPLQYAKRRLCCRLQLRARQRPGVGSKGGGPGGGRDAVAVGAGSRGVGRPLFLLKQPPQVLGLLCKHPVWGVVEGYVYEQL